MKSGVGIVSCWGWYKVAIMIFPVCVVTSIASKSDKKLSISLCTIFFSYCYCCAICGIIKCIFLCILYPAIFMVESSGIQWLFIKMMSASSERYVLDNDILFSHCWTLG